MTARAGAPAPLADTAEIKRALAILTTAPGEVRELRGLKATEPGKNFRFTASGYYNDPSAAASDAARYSGHSKGLYTTANPVNPDLLARAANHAIQCREDDPTTTDRDILRRVWLLLDFDYERPAGISSSDSERAAAFKLAANVRDWLAERGWPAPVEADSGNGAHLLYRINQPNNDAARDLVKSCLEALAWRFNGQVQGVKVDTSVFNAARIVKLYGTMACKGDNIPERPWRMSRIVAAPRMLEIVTQQQLEALSAAAPKIVEPPRQAYSGAPGAPRDVPQFIREHGLQVLREGPWNGGYRWIIVCAMDPDHRDKSAYILQFPSGAVAAGCHHDSCQGWGWAELRAKYEVVNATRPTPPAQRPSANGHTPEPVAAAPEHSTNGAHPEPAPIGHTGEHLSDLGNAKRLVRYFGQDLRYTEAWGYVCWDGRRFNRDTTGAAMRLTKATVGRMYAEAAELPESERAAFAKWAISSESGPHLREIVKLAQSEIGIAAEHTDFDKDPWLLNCKNGTVDLHDGSLRPHDRADLLTKLAPTDFDAAAECPNWHRFLSRIFKNNQALINFIQRAVGYSISGSVDEQVMFLCHGVGKNGKSTFLGVLQRILGDYAQSTPAAALLVKDRDGGASPEIARMAGARFVTAIETEDGKRLAVALIKQLTGGDIMTARHLNRDYFEFAPQLKLWLATNHKPVIRDTTESIWRRVLLIPFEVVIPEDERDPNLPELLLCEAPGILAWAVRGCLDWWGARLQAPNIVLSATQTYRAEMDLLAAFLDECCLLGRTYTVPHAQLYNRYKGWAEENGERPMSGRAFSRALNEKEYYSRNGSGNAVVWDGLGLRVEGYDAS